MKQFIEGAFSILAMLFEKIPILNKLSGYRSVLGFAGLAVTVVLKQQGIGDQALIQALEYGFMGLTALALNSKGRESKD